MTLNSSAWPSSARPSIQVHDPQVQDPQFKCMALKCKTLNSSAWPSSARPSNQVHGPQFNCMTLKCMTLSMTLKMLPLPCPWPRAPCSSPQSFARSVAARSSAPTLILHDPSLAPNLDTSTPHLIQVKPPNPIPWHSWLH